MNEQARKLAELTGFFKLGVAADGATAAMRSAVASSNTAAGGSAADIAAAAKPASTAATSAGEDWEHF